MLENLLRDYKDNVIKTNGLFSNEFHDSYMIDMHILHFLYDTIDKFIAHVNSEIGTDDFGDIGVHYAEVSLEDPEWCVPFVSRGKYDAKELSYMLEPFNFISGDNMSESINSVNRDEIKEFFTKEFDNY